MQLAMETNGTDELRYRVAQLAMPVYSLLSIYLTSAYL